MKNLIQAGCVKTKRALLWMNLTAEPLVALYTLLPFILRKDLGASLFELSIFATLRPVLSVCSFYWGAYLANRRGKLLSNLMSAWALARIPFLLLPFINTVWFLLFAAGCYQLFHRAGTPALMEILKLNLPKQEREHTFSFYYLLSFLESVVLGISMAYVLDGKNADWSLLFSLSALVGLSSMWMQRKIPLSFSTSPSMEPLPPPFQRMVQPWKEGFALIRSRPDFAHFQWGFMLGGFGLMLMTPALAVYYADELALSHLNIATARLILMGVGVVCSSLLWKRSMAEVPIFRLTSIILIGFGLFPLILLLAPYHLLFLYLAFFLYGVAQAGSHLLWNLSGTLFAAQEESSRFTTVGVLMVGLRGAVGPLLGGLLCAALGAKAMLLLGMGISFYGAWYMIAKAPQGAYAK